MRVKLWGLSQERFICPKRFNVGISLLCTSLNSSKGPNMGVNRRGFSKRCFIGPEKPDVVIRVYRRFLHRPKELNVSISLPLGCCSHSLLRLGQPLLTKRQSFAYLPCSFLLIGKLLRLNNETLLSIREALSGKRSLVNWLTTNTNTGNGLKFTLNLVQSTQGLIQPA